MGCFFPVVEGVVPVSLTFDVAEQVGGLYGSKQPRRVTFLVCWGGHSLVGREAEGDLYFNSALL